jgi:hypothetical protein
MVFAAYSPWVIPTGGGDVIFRARAVTRLVYALGSVLVGQGVLGVLLKLWAMPDPALLGFELGVLYVGVRCWRSGVLVDADRVVVRGFFRGRRISQAAMRAVTAFPAPQWCDDSWRIRRSPLLMSFPYGTRGHAHAHTVEVLNDLAGAMSTSLTLPDVVLAYGRQEVGTAGEAVRSRVWLPVRSVQSLAVCDYRRRTRRSVSIWVAQHRADPPQWSVAGA